MGALLENTGRDQLGKAWAAVAQRLLKEEQKPLEVFETMLGVSLLGLKQSVGPGALSTELRVLADAVDRGDGLAIRVLLNEAP